MSEKHFGDLCIVLAPPDQAQSRLRHSRTPGEIVLIIEFQQHNGSYGPIWNTKVENGPEQWVQEDELEVIATHVHLPDPDIEVRKLLGVKES